MSKARIFKTIHGQDLTLYRGAEEIDRVVEHPKGSIIYFMGGRTEVVRHTPAEVREILAEGDPQ